MQPFNRSMTTKPTQPNNQEVFIYLLWLTGFFLLLEISYFIQCNQAYLSDYTFISNTIHIPAKIIPGILFFLTVQLSLHILYAAFIWLMTKTIVQNNQLKYAMIFWGIGIATILLANQVYFPNSKFADLTYIIFNATAAKILFFLFASLSSIILIKFAFKIRPKKIFIILLFIPVILNLTHQKNNIHPIATAEKPNIIIIGVDSLRPDFLSYFGAENSTPFMDNFLNTSTVYPNTITPIARTFPAWISILTGQYPRHNSIRTNLSLQNQLNSTNTLPAILKKHGYETIYATDETRFSNINQSMGFDKIISPPMGLNDFLIGTFNDFPISNLLINTSIGKFLFPYSYANRPIYFAYEPNSFLNLIKPELAKPQTKPLFLSIHFCLTHYPYLSAHQSGRDVKIIKRYQESVETVDQQLNRFFNLLNKNKLLTHAIIILLSDHGEALELPGDRITDKNLYEFASKKPAPLFYPSNEEAETIDESAGHGTDVLGLPQYHSLLAIKLMGLGKQDHHDVPDLVSLLDIKPTILSLLHLPSPDSDGQSLFAPISAKPIFIESDFSPAAIRTVHPELEKVVLDGLQIFQIDPKTTRLFVKPDMNHMILQSKQFAVFYQHWVLALYPHHKTDNLPILVNLNTGEWTDSLSSPLAQSAPVIYMQAALQTFYGNELKRT